MQRSRHQCNAVNYSETQCSEVRVIMRTVRVMRALGTPHVFCFIRNQDLKVNIYYKKSRSKCEHLL